MTSALALSVDGLAAQRRTRVITVTALCGLAALVLGGLAGSLTAGGHLTGILVIGSLALPVVIWKWPGASPALAILAATLIEQIPVDSSPLKSLPVPLFTDHLPLFQSLNDGMGLTGILLSPIELIMMLALVIWLARAVAQRDLSLPYSYLATGLAILLVVALFAEARGLASGADLRESLHELRPFVYLGGFYLLASRLLTRYGALRALLWVFVIGAGIKGIQGSLQFMAVRGRVPRPDAILAHEEAVFLGVFLLLTAALWIFGDKSRLRWVATGLAPAVAVASLGNQRRASWLILAVGLAALFVIAWIRLPERRRLLGAALVLVTVAGIVYVPLAWNGSGGLSQPARAIRSLVMPDPRDASSDLYRRQEDANLQLDIQRSMPLGAGFGVPIDYALPIADLPATVPSLRFVPHNTILYVWLRLGLVGILAFWWLIGAAFLAACRLVRFPDRRLAVFGTIVICALIAYVLEGAYDLGLSWFRLGVFMGCMLGALEAARELSRMPSVPLVTPAAA